MVWVCVKYMDIKKELICSKCNSRYVYTLKDGTIICRKCGFRESKK